MLEFLLCRETGHQAIVTTVNRGFLIALTMLAACAAFARGADPAEQHFIDKVKPLLDSRCISCHGAEKQKGGLRMDSRAALIKGGDTGPALVPGKPSESLLVQAVNHTKKDLEMPPKEKLTLNDIAVVERWIRDGAPWPETVVAQATNPAKSAERIGDAWHDPRNPIVKIFGGQRLDLWSLKPITNPKPPSVKNRQFVRNPIDQFILARLESAQLSPAPEADRRTLARRVFYDLTGLPPTPEEMNSFLVDRSPNAYEKLVDHLLASRRYGEHVARQWLDVIRYSDSNGFDWDEFRPQAWRFRDYVIRSLNADKPFNQFIREQLAGDELLAGPPRNAVEQDLLIATGYLRLGPHDNSAPSFNEQDRSRAELMADLTETTGAAFLGLTLSCCRCHDHKYDPLSQADHFRFRSFFTPVKFADDLPLDVDLEQARIRQHNELVTQQVKPLLQERDGLFAQTKTRLKTAKIAALNPEERAFLDTPKEQRIDTVKAAIALLEKKIEPTDKDVMAALTPEEKTKHEELSKRIAALEKQKQPFTRGLLMVDAAGNPPDTRILFQGDHQQPRDAVEPGFISIVDPNPALMVKPVNANSTGRRLTLAEWIASPKNPLTARVLVNRIWQDHFGHGLVATPNDFGLAGARPTHPELLDWLAAELIREKWSLKRLHRLIVTSATYRQTSIVTLERGIHAASTASVAPVQSAAMRNANSDLKRAEARSTQISDAENTLLSHQNIRRLSAEQLRDSLLAVTGLLTERNGGPPVWPELPAEVLQANPAFLDDNAEKTKGWYPSAATNQHVRSIYLVQKRTVRVPFMETFDLPENSTSCARRNESTVAPQALSLLNSPFALELAKALATRIEKKAGAFASDRVDLAFERVLQRKPDAEERRACLEFFEKRTFTELCRALLNLNEFVYVD